MVSLTDSYIAIEPLASRFAFETWILPMEHKNRFENISAKETYDLASGFQETIDRINAAVEKSSHNLVVHASPINEIENTLFHWHIEIMPKLGNVAGFEWGSGFYINPVFPETAAEVLRDVTA